MEHSHGHALLGAQLDDRRTEVHYQALSLLFRVEHVFEEYERENVIMYLASNYSVNKHLSFSALRGMYDDDIKVIMEETREYLREYLKSLKNH